MTKLTAEQQTKLDQAKPMVTMMLLMAVADRMKKEGHLENIENATSPEDKLAKIHESERSIQDEFGQAFKENDEAQAMKRAVYDEVIEHHYKYFGLSKEDALGLEA